MSDLVSLAQAAARLEQYAWYCQADIDAEREPKLGNLRQCIEAMKREIEAWEQRSPSR